MSNNKLLVNVIILVILFSFSFSSFNSPKENPGTNSFSL